MHKPYSPSRDTIKPSGADNRTPESSVGGKKDRIGEETEDVRHTIDTIRSTETVIKESTGLHGQELTDATDEFLVDRAEAGIVGDTLNDPNSLDDALIEGALEVTGDRPQATTNPIVILEENDKGNPISNEVETLYQTGATLPGGESAAEVIARTVDKYDADKRKPPISDELDSALQYYYLGGSQADIMDATGIDPDEVARYIRSLPQEAREHAIAVRRKALESRAADNSRQEAVSEPEQMTKNLDILRNSEMGEVLERAYRKAIELDARLADIVIVPIVGSEHRYAFASASWVEGNLSGKHEVHVRLHDLSETLARFRESMKIKSNVEKIAKTLGIDAAEVTPELLYIQSTIHEMGHTIEFMDYQARGKTPEDHRHDRAVERKRLPLERTVGTLMRPQNIQTIRANWESASRVASKKYSAHKGRDIGIRDFDQLVDATADVYRDTKFEHAADVFAANVLRGLPDIIGKFKAT